MNYQFQFDAVFAAWPLLLKGTWITVQLSLTATLLGLVVAIFCAWGKTGGPGWLRFLINAYIEVIRNTPFLVQLFFFFFALPSIGLRWSPYTAALTAMVVNLGAYAAEIVRAGIESIPKGQMEAARSIGMSSGLAMRTVVLPQAVVRMIPPLGNEFIALIKNSALVSLLTIHDLMHEGQKIISVSYRSLEVYLAIAVVYFILTGVTSLVLRRTELRLRAGGMVQ